MSNGLIYKVCIIIKTLDTNDMTRILNEVDRIDLYICHVRAANSTLCKV